MVLCASNADHTAVEIMEPPADAPIGERVTFDKYVGEPEPENKIAKKKIFEAVAPDLKTNAEGICVWKDATSQTSAGPIKASKGMPDAHVS
jgi:aminoacyl tRNA synthase complex-interacting multifunctional protein 1